MATGMGDYKHNKTFQKIVGFFLHRKDLDEGGWGCKLQWKLHSF